MIKPNRDPYGNVLHPPHGPDCPVCHPRRARNICIHRVAGKIALWVYVATVAVGLLTLFFGGYYWMVGN